MYLEKLLMDLFKINTQCGGHVWLQGMYQNSFFLGAIDREAIENRADALHQSCFSSNDITTKNT